MKTASLILVSSTAVLAGFIIMPASAYAQSRTPVAVSASVDYVSEYVFRGVSFANTALQPSISASYGNFTLGAWASTALGESSALAGDEIDIYGSYSWSLTGLVSANAGATLYHFPQSGDLFNLDSQELGSTIEGNFGLSFNTALSPNVTAYYDATLDAFTLIGSVSQSYLIADKASLNWGLTGGFVAAGYQWGTGAVKLSYAVTGKSSLYIGANYTINSENVLDFPTSNDITPSNNLFWGGVGFSTGF